jgi:hypothetical protein
MDRKLTSYRHDVPQYFTRTVQIHSLVLINTNQ